MHRLLLIAVLLATAPALAQQQSTAADRVATQIGALFMQVQQQQDTITTLQTQLDKAQARVKELEDAKQNTAEKK